MPAPQPEPREPVYSPAIGDLTVPGVVVELDPDDAWTLGSPPLDSRTRRAMRFASSMSSESRLML